MMSFFIGVLLHKCNKFLEVDEIGRFNAPRHVGTSFQWLVSARHKRGEDGWEIPGFPR